MTPNERREAGGEESLVPLIEEEEQRLAQMLEEVRTHALEIVREAERAAEEQVEATRRRLPSLREERRRQAAGRFQKEADALRQESSGTLAALRQAAESGREAAVQKIVESVWPVKTRG